MRQLALRCVLSAKASENELVVLYELALEEPSTKEMAGILSANGINSSALIVTAEADMNVVKSARNLPGMNITPANLMNVVDVLNGRKLIMTVAAVRKAEEIWGKELSEGGSDEPVRGA
jgi:large subunit ribosomal protein L4